MLLFKLIIICNVSLWSHWNNFLHVWNVLLDLFGSINLLWSQLDLLLLSHSQQCRMWKWVTLISQKSHDKTPTWLPSKHALLLHSRFGARCLCHHVMGVNLCVCAHMRTPTRTHTKGEVGKLLALIPSYNNAKSDFACQTLLASGVFDMLRIIQVAKGFTLHWSDLRMLASVRCTRNAWICCPRYGITPTPSLVVCLLALYAPGCRCTNEEPGALLPWKKRNISSRCFSLLNEKLQASCLNPERPLWSCSWWMKGREVKT